MSRVLFKNESQFPWFILVPRKNNIQEVYQLAKEERLILIEEINQLSVIVNNYFKPDKLNIGALGNIVSQLHVHLVARYQKDVLWPHGIWQSAFSAIPYEENELKSILPDLRDLVMTSSKAFC